MPPGASFQVTHYVPSYCFPELWPNANFLSAVPPEAQQFTVGWHPTWVADFFSPQTGFKNRKRFAELFDLENCVALGEVGLDYEQEQNPEHHQKQAIMLQALVQKAIVKGKPLLLHIRDPIGQNEANCGVVICLRRLIYWQHTQFTYTALVIPGGNWVCGSHGSANASSA